MTPPSRSERLAAVTLLIGLIVLVGTFGVLPAIGHLRSTQDELAHNRAMIARLVERAGERASAHAAAERTVARIAASHRYLRAETEGLAAANLQGRVEATVAANGGEIKTMRNLPAQSAEGVVRLGLSVSLSITQGGLLRTLGELESGAPFLFVEHLQVTSSAWRRALLNQPPAGDALTVRLDLYGYMPPPEDGT